jgi:hypothetical protein
MLNNSKLPLRVGIVGTPGYVQADSTVHTEQIIKVIGENTGNLAFQYAVASHIASTKHYVSWDSSDPAWVREVCDMLVYPAANAINPRRDHTQRADFIEAVDLPCVVVGLGAQAPELGSEVKLNKGSERWLKALAERSHSIGVRGEYTADVLSRIGIQNTLVLGCPSHLINPLPTLGEVLEKKFYHNQLQKLVVAAGSPEKKSLKRVEQKLIGWLRSHNGTYVCQAPPQLISLARNGENEVSKEWLNQFRRYLLPTLSYYTQPRSKFVSFIKQHFRIFFNVEEWLEFLSCFDLSLGTRMHGSSLATQSATPAICIYHDSRTRELCRTLAIPHVSVNQFLSVRDIKELIDSVCFDGKSFDQNRIKLAYQYRELLIKSGISTSDRLNLLAEVKQREDFEIETSRT